MKVIFLYIEGVLNTKETYERIRRQKGYSIMIDTEIDEFRLGYLREIINQTDAKIVLSSSFRYFFTRENSKIVPTTLKAKRIYDKFFKYGIEIYDTTPTTMESREEQIKEWLSNRDDIESFVIIDDDSTSFDELYNNLIHTSRIRTSYLLSFMKESTGLSEEHIDIAVKMLNIKDKIYVR